MVTERVYEDITIHNSTSPENSKAGLTFIYTVEEISKSSVVPSQYELEEILRIYNTNEFFKPVVNKSGKISYFKRDLFKASIKEILKKSEYNQKEEILEYLKGIDKLELEKENHKEEE